MELTGPVGETKPKTHPNNEKVEKWQHSAVTLPTAGCTAHPAADLYSMLQPGIALRPTQQNKSKTEPFRAVLYKSWPRISKAGATGASLAVIGCHFRISHFTGLQRPVSPCFALPTPISTQGLSPAHLTIQPATGDEKRHFSWTPTTPSLFGSIFGPAVGFFHCVSF